MLLFPQAHLTLSQADFVPPRSRRRCQKFRELLVPTLVGTVVSSCRLAPHEHSGAQAKQAPQGLLTD